jgi:hypothetical protein
MRYVPSAAVSAFMEIAPSALVTVIAAFAAGAPEVDVILPD